MSIREKFRGVRWRTTVAATLTVATFLALAGLAFALAQRQQLESSITEASRDQATDSTIPSYAASLEARH